MLFARILLRAVAMSATIGVISSCRPSENGTQRGDSMPARPVTPPSTQMTSLTGTLRGGMMAIGGETTGWTLVGDGAVGGVELDVSQVKQDAKRLDGKRVTVTGQMLDKTYVERGTVRLMRVERIVEARSP